MEDEPDALTTHRPHLCMGAPSAPFSSPSSCRFSDSGVACSSGRGSGSGSRYVTTPSRTHRWHTTSGRLLRHISNIPVSTLPHPRLLLLSAVACPLAILLIGVLLLLVVCALYMSSASVAIFTSLPNMNIRPVAAAAHSPELLAHRRFQRSADARATVNVPQTALATTPPNLFCPDGGTFGLSTYALSLSLLPSLSSPLKRPPAVEQPEQRTVHTV